MATLQEIDAQIAALKERYGPSTNKNWNTRGQKLINTLISQRDAMITAGITLQNPNLSPVQAWEARQALIPVALDARQSQRDEVNPDYIDPTAADKLALANAHAAQNTTQWQAAVNAYNTGQPVSAEFVPLLNRLNSYYRQGQAAPGNLDPTTAASALRQWAIDAQPGGFEKFMNVALPITAGILTGGIGGLGAIGGGAVAGATSAGMQGGGIGDIAKGAVLGGGLAYGGSQLANLAGTTSPATAGGMTAAELAAADPYLASIGGASGITPAMEAASMLSAAGAPGVAASTAAGNVATGLGYDMLGTAITGASSPAITQATQTLAQAGITPEQVAANQNNPTWMDSVTKATGLSTSQLGAVASTGLNMLGGYLQGQSATDAAQTAANAQIEAARIAAEASKFKPVGVTTRFGGSQFGYDAKGNLISAGYQLSPEAKAQQDALMAMSGQMLTQYQGAPTAAAPMGQAAQTMFGLGQGYLQTSPQAQAQQYMAEQQALLAPSREREMAALQARLQAQGRLGLATGGTTTGMLASQPELEALYNAQRMQDLQLAAQATQGGQQYAQFGAGMVGAGGEMLQGMYGTQKAAYAPYQTALGGAVGMEQLGQQPMDIGTAIGAKTSTAGAQAGMLQAQGMQNAAQTMQPANAYNPWAAMLTGAGQSISNYQAQQQQQQQQNQLLSALAAGWGK